MAEQGKRVATELPTEILSRVDVATLGFLATGRLGNVLYRARLADGSAGVLSVAEGAAASDVRAESERLTWLDGRAGAPSVVSTWTDRDRAILLVQEIPGRPLHECLTDHDSHELLHAIAQALRAIHDIPVANCPFDSGVDRELDIAQRLIAEDRVDITRFEEETAQSPTDALAELRDTREIISDRVFTHGDFALPNVMISAGQVSGVVDWSQAGVSGRHRDFMCVETSIARNCAERVADQLTDQFYTAYGIAAPDRQQIQYFWKLDQFWTHGR